MTSTLHTLFPPSLIPQRINCGFVLGIMTKGFCFRADSARSSVLIKVGVLRRVFVTLWAMSSLLEVLSLIASTTVHFMEHWLKMGRIAALAVTTKMINLHALRNRPDQQFIGNAMDVHVFPAKRNMAISIAVATGRKTSGPDPTKSVAIKMNFFLNAFRQIGNLHSSIYNRRYVV